MEVKVKRLTETAILPERGSASAAGYDLFYSGTEPVELASGEAALIPTGLSVAIPEGYFGGVYARSGLSLKEGLRPANCVGVIDADYRGELKVPLRNDDAVPRTVSPGQKVAQLIIQPFLAVEFKDVLKLDPTDRGTGGFGSTGR